MPFGLSSGESEGNLRGEAHRPAAQPVAEAQSPAPTHTQRHHASKKHGGGLHCHALSIRVKSRVRPELARAERVLQTEKF